MRSLAQRLHNNADGSELCIGTLNGERDTLPFLVDSYDDELSGTLLAGNAGSLNAKALNARRDELGVGDREQPAPRKRELHYCSGTYGTPTVIVITTFRKNARME